MFGLYLFALILGGGAFVISLMMGDHDHGHHHDFGGSHVGDDPHIGITNLKVVFAFITAFGAVGLLTLAQGFGPGLSTLISVSSGFALATIVFFVLKLAFSQQSTSHVMEVVGRTGYLTVGAIGPNPGEVSIAPASGHQTFVARSITGETIDAGSIVRITSVQGETALVERT